MKVDTDKCYTGNEILKVTTRTMKEQVTEKVTEPNRLFMRVLISPQRRDSKNTGGGYDKALPRRSWSKTTNQMSLYVTPPRDDADILTFSALNFKILFVEHANKKGDLLFPQKAC